MSKDEIVRVMKEWTMASVEKRYNEYLKTPEGEELVRVGKVMMEQNEVFVMTMERDFPAGMFYTKYVREAYLPDAWKGIAKKVATLPFGVNNCCLQNAEWVQREIGWKAVWGFNITACRCGGRMSLEPHSLNRHPDGSYVDITRDFQGETEKWFLPVENENWGFPEYKKSYDGDMIAYQPACRCMKLKQKWDNRGRLFFDDEDEIVGWIEDMKQYPKCAIRNVTRF